MFHKTLMAALIGLCTWPAFAGPQADVLGKCLADNTTGRERKDLARWMFIAMSAHPEMRQLSSATDGDREQSSKVMADLFTKLLSESCPTQARQAMQSEGSQAMQIAFGTLGQVAMQELMSDREVNAAISQFERFVDKKKVDAAMGR